MPSFLLQFSNLYIANANVPHPFFSYFLIGKADWTVVEKNMLTEEQKKEHGQYPVHGKKISDEMRGLRLVELKSVENSECAGV